MKKNLVAFTDSISSIKTRKEYQIGREIIIYSKTKLADNFIPVWNFYILKSQNTYFIKSSAKFLSDYTFGTLGDEILSSTFTVLTVT